MGGKVLRKVLKRPVSDNVITSAPKVFKLRKPSEELDTSVVDAHAKAYNIELSEGDARTIKGYAVTSLSEVLGISTVTATRWEKSGLIPKPTFVSARGAIYHVEEVRAMYRLLHAHQKEHRQYRPEHSELRRKLFEENARIRRGLFPKT